MVLASRKCQAADQEMFRTLGVEPRRLRIVALKSSVHFRADFEPIASEVLVVTSPAGACRPGAVQGSNFAKVCDFARSARSTADTAA